MDLKLIGAEATEAEKAAIVGVPEALTVEECPAVSGSDGTCFYLLPAIDAVQSAGRSAPVRWIEIARRLSLRPRSTASPASTPSSR